MPVQRQIAVGMRVAEDLSKTESPVVVKKYANRRLYNTKTSSYVTLDHLCEMVKQGVDFEVHDARTGEDITRAVLTQIILEEEAKGRNLLPIRFLRQLIRFYGDSMQAFVPGYLDLSMEAFVRNQDQMREHIASMFGNGREAAEALARQNVVAFEQVMQMSVPRHPEPVQTPGPSASDFSSLKSEIEEVRRQLAELSSRK